MQHSSKYHNRLLLLIIGSTIPAALWLVLSTILRISDRYLPTPIQVLSAAYDLEPSIIIHAAYTTARLIIGYSFGLLTGITIAVLLARSYSVRILLTPLIQSLRVTPSAAIVPFFLLWFGFSEFGRYFLVTTAIAFNISVAGLQLVDTIPEVHSVFFRATGQSPGTLSLQYVLPRILEGLLPTLRFSLALAIGAVTVSELLGSQVGIGYLIQTSRSTFSLNVLFLSSSLLAIIAAALDSALILCWRRIVFWKTIKTL